jgi:hypothetical protein
MSGDLSTALVASRNGDEAALSEAFELAYSELAASPEGSFGVCRPAKP